MVTRIRPFLWIFVLSFLINSVAKANQEWTSVLAPMGVSAGTSKPFFLNSQTGIIPGAGAFVLRTTDGGITWTRVSVAPATVGSFTAKSAWMTDANNIWLVGTGGKIFKSDNGGLTWTAQASGISTTLQDVAFANTSVGWAAGDGGKVLKTIDGGGSWSVQNIGTVSNMFTVAALNTSTVLVAGADGAFKKSTDGGANWATSGPVITKTFNDFYFLDANTGWVGAQGAGLYKTTDGGSTWTQLATGQLTSTQGYLNLHFMDANNGVSTFKEVFQMCMMTCTDFDSYSTSVMLTSDGGSTWTRKTLPALNGSTATAAAGWMRAANTVSIFPNYKNNPIHNTTDGGNNWTQATIGGNPVNAWSFTALTFMDANNGWAVASSPSVEASKFIRTNDGGATWTVPQGVSPTAQRVFSMAVIDSNTAVATAESGIIVRTTDGGATWNMVNSGVGSLLYDVKFKDSLNGWATASGAVILKTTDAGATWTTQYSGGGGSGNDLQAITIADANTIYIVGSTQKMAKSIDGGATWTHSTITGGSGNSYFTKPFYFADANTGFGAAPSTDTVFRTTDGGTTWTTATVAGLQGIYGSVKSGTTVFVLGGTGLWKTEDNGQSFTKILDHAGTEPNVYGPGGLSYANGKIFAAMSSGNMVSTPAVPDSIAPQAGTVSDEGAATSSSTALSASWTGFTDNVAVAGYRYSIGTSAGDTSIRNWTNVGNASTVQATGLTLTNATQYFINIQAYDISGNNSATASTDGITVDTQGPTSGTLADEGAFTGSTSILSASWSGFSDINGIGEYSYSIGISAGDTSIKAWTSAGTNTSVSASGLAMTHGTQYFVNVRSKDSAGNLGSVVSSDGITVDTSIPSAGTVTDSGTYSSSTTALGFSWTGFSDTVSGIVEYSYSIGTSAGGTTARDWTAAGTATEISASGLTLTDGTKYFINIRAKDGAGNLSSVASSDGITVDGSAPGAATDPFDTGQFTTSTTTISASWSTASDAHSGLTNYSASLVTNTLERVAHENVACVFRSASVVRCPPDNVVFSGLTLSNGGTYKVMVQALNNAGLYGQITITDGITVDTTAPDAITGLVDAGASQTSTSSISASWNAAQDAQSGVVTYTARLVDASGTVLSQSTITATSIVFNLSTVNLIVGQTYRIQVSATNGAGLTNEFVSTDGILITAPPVADTTPPSAVSNLVDAGASQTGTTTLTASWTAATDNVGVTQYVVTLLNGATTVSESTITATSISFSGLNLTVGQTYTVRVIAKDAAGNQGTAANTDGILITAPPVADTTPPSAVSNLVDAGASQTATTTLTASWTAATDNVGVTQYVVTLLNGATTVSESTITATSISFSGLNLTVGQTYTVRVIAKDAAGNQSTASTTDGIQIVSPPAPPDTTPPAGGTVSDAGESTEDLTQLSASWTGFTDASGIAEYSYSIGIDAGASTIKAWTSAGTNTTVTVTGLSLVKGQTYYFNVRAKDPAGNVSTVVSSNGIRAIIVGGDVDGDGAVTMADALLANKFAGGSQQPTADQLKQADVAVPKDGKVTTEDANLILRCAKGTIRGNPDYPWCPALTREASETDGMASEGGAP